MRTILVVDDMAVFREPIEACLRSRGFNTLAAANGADALAACRRAWPDLILLDLAMPDMDGLKFLKLTHPQRRQNGTVVIILTALAQRDCVVRCAGLGISDYLLKSRFSLKDLLDRIHLRLKLEPQKLSA